MKINKASGVDFSRLINKDQYANFFEIIKCKICFNILINPYDCEKCGNSFCYDCIHEIFEHHNPCPMNCVNFKIKPSSYGIISYLNTLKFDCLNKCAGCTEVIPYSKVIEHDKECKYCYAKCPNIQCTKEIKRQLLEYHVRQECEFSFFKCQNCEMDFNRNEYFEHIENCKSIQQALDYKIVYKRKESSSDIQSHSQSHKSSLTESNSKGKKDIDLLSMLPELKEISLGGFLKIILYQISKNNSELDAKFVLLREEIKELKEEMIRVSNNNFVFIENFNSELEMLNDKISSLDINDNVKKSIEDSVNLAIRESIQSRGVSTFTSTTTSTSTPSVTKCTERSECDKEKEKGSSGNSPTLSTAVPYNTINIEGSSKKMMDPKDKGTGNESSSLKTIKLDNDRLRTLNKFPGNQSPKNRSPAHGNTPAKSSTKGHRACGHEGRYHDSSEGSLNTSENVTTLPQRTTNFASLKMMIKNQESITQYLIKILNKLDTQEKLITTEGKENAEFLKSFMSNDLLEDIKRNHLEVSIDTTNIIKQKLEECSKMFTTVSA